MMGTSPTANDGILFSSLRGVGLKNIKDGASNTIIMGERGISDSTGAGATAGSAI